ncbi:MAG: hypothetical protein H0W02_18705 [Ktedonobacteraceae bacterium]|nr:hypothetical protein [Ktedonobacteraceae bacterium]
MRKQLKTSGIQGGGRRGRFSPLALVGILVPLVLVLIVGTAFVLPRLRSQAANVNGDCTLIVPDQPLTVHGLATPYQLMATDPAKGPCNEATAGQAAFVQAAVIDPATGHIAVYDPLVIDQGTKPLAAPVMPVLPVGGIVGIWFGFNGNNLLLQGPGARQGHCVNGIKGSLFGQFSYCNAPAFFESANQAIHAGKLVPPPLGRAKDGLPCPTVRDFSVVDMDQSDNVTTAYLMNANGQTAQMNAANIAAEQGAHTQVNGSDNRLLAIALDGTLGCRPWMAPDLADPGQTVTALPLNELQAAAHQTDPVAMVPNRDPMVTVNGNTNLAKLNAYRRGVDQPQVENGTMSSTRTYCNNLFTISPTRMLLDAHLTKVRPSPDAAVANSLFTFLAQRFVATYEANGLNCMKLLNLPDPVQVKNDANGVAIAATINGTVVNTPLDCNVNGTLVVGCNGTTTINGQTCSLMMDRKAHQIVITCPAQQNQP